MRCRWFRFPLAHSQGPFKRTRVFLDLLEFTLKPLPFSAVRRLLDSLLQVRDREFMLRLPNLHLCRIREGHKIRRVEGELRILIRPHIPEEGEELVIIGLRDRIKFVIVTARTSKSHTKKRLAGRRDDVVELIIFRHLLVIWLI